MRSVSLGIFHQRQIPILGGPAFAHWARTRPRLPYVKSGGLMNWLVFEPSVAAGIVERGALSGRIRGGPPRKLLAPANE